MNDKGSKEEVVYTVSEVKDILGISDMTAYRLVRRGLFKSVRIGGSIRILKSSFDSWLKEQLEE